MHIQQINVDGEEVDVETAGRVQFSVFLQGFEDQRRVNIILENDQVIIEQYTEGDGYQGCEQEDKVTIIR